MVTIKAAKSILGSCLAAAGKRKTTYNAGLAYTLYRVAHDHVKVRDATVLAQLRKMATRMRAPTANDLTEKNKKLLRQFDDNIVRERLWSLPVRLWNEAKRDPRKTTWTLAKLQAALAIAMLPYLPLRRENLTALAFGEHVHLQLGPGGMSMLEVPANQVKNEQALAFEIAPHIVQMLAEYRDTAAFGILERTPTRIFVHPDGSPKQETTISALIKRYLAKHAGIAANAHLFRHLAAKLILEAIPGAHETVREVLGQRSLMSTRIYAGFDSVRAGKIFQKILEDASKPRFSRSRSRVRNPTRIA